MSETGEPNPADSLFFSDYQSKTQIYSVHMIESKEHFLIMTYFKFIFYQLTIGQSTVSALMEI